MTKKEFIEFTCDECGKTETVEKCIGFPYHKDWEYLYILSGKTLEGYAPGIQTDVEFVNAKDKHFCCLKCLLKYTEIKYKEKKAGTKEHKKANPKEK